MGWRLRSHVAVRRKVYLCGELLFGFFLVVVVTYSKEMVKLKSAA
jgi:hypothetical protein